jgi:hypothetical protein
MSSRKPHYLGNDKQGTGKRFLRILRDGELKALVESGKEIQWFHDNTVGSMSWALEHGGYSIEEE